MLRILLDITEVLLGFAAAVVAVVTTFIIIRRFARAYREHEDGWDR